MEDQRTQTAIGLLILAGVISVIVTDQIKFSMLVSLVVVAIIAVVFPMGGIILSVPILLVSFFKNNTLLLTWINKVVKGG